MGALLLAVAGLLALLLGLYQMLASRRTLRRLDAMLTAAITGAFQESAFDESAASALEAKMARFLNGTAASTRNLAQERTAIQSLLADISHQTKTPIANILLYASLLEEAPLPPDQREQAEMICHQAQKLSFLIQVLVRASRLETGILTLSPAACPLEPLLHEAMLQGLPRAEERGIALTLEPTQAAACMDAKWTAEALYNVVDNALKYTQPGGHIRLRVREYAMFCAIEVSDDGPGIPEQEQAAIFSRFYRGTNVRAQEGLGIGLYLTREILGRQGGYIKVRTKLGKGCCFSLYLPKAEQEDCHLA